MMNKKNMMEHLPTIDVFLNISTLSTKRTCEEYMPHFMMDLADDLKDKGRR